MQQHAATGARSPETPDVVSRRLTAAGALAFVRKHGVVLVSAKGTAPRLTEAIIGEPIKGSWWTHAQSRQIYAVLGAVTESDEVLVCRLINGKLTLVHRRLWPSLVRVASRFSPEQLTQVRDEHTPSGRHMNHEVPFPQWVPPEVMEQAKRIGEKEALVALSACLPPMSNVGHVGGAPMSVLIEFLETVQPERRAVIRELDAMIRKAAPDLVPSLKWRNLTYQSKRNVCSLINHQQYVNLQVWGGAELEDPSCLLQGTGKGMRHIRFVPGAKINRPAVVAIIKQAAKLARA